MKLYIAMLMLFLLSNCFAAIITVVDDGNDGAGTLREALEQLAQDGDEIVFEVKKIKLESRITLAVANVTITGPVALDGGKKTKLLNIEAAGVVIDSVTFTNAKTEDGAAALAINANDVQVLNCLFQNNFAQKSGAAIAIEKNLTGLQINNCEFTKNTCEFTGAAIDIEDNTTVDSIDNCAFTNNKIVGNQVGGGNGGAIAIHNGANITITNCIFFKNQAKVNAGAIFLEEQAIVSLDNCVFSGNKTLQGFGGAIAMDDEDNNGNVGGTLDIVECVFTKNQAQTQGGAIFVLAGQIINEIADTTFDSNTARKDNGGAIFNDGTITLIQRSTFSKNKTTFNGGAIFNEVNGTITANNATFSANSAKDSGGAIFDNAGAGITLDSVTITKNIAAGKGDDDGGGGILTAGNGTVACQNSIIAENKAQQGSDVLAINAGAFTSNDFNLIGDDGGLGDQGFNGDNDQLNVDPELEALGDNGGLTQTHALDDDSPAVDAGDTDLAEDQRGFTRPDAINNIDDIGAFELNAGEVKLSNTRHVNFQQITGTGPRDPAIFWIDQDTKHLMRGTVRAKTSLVNIVTISENFPATKIFATNAETLFWIDQDSQALKRSTIEGSKIIETAVISAKEKFHPELICCGGHKPPQVMWLDDNMQLRLAEVIENQLLASKKPLDIVVPATQLSYSELVKTIYWIERGSNHLVVAIQTEEGKWLEPQVVEGVTNVSQLTTTDESIYWIDRETKQMKMAHVRDGKLIKLYDVVIK